MDQIAVIVGLACTVLGVAVGYGAFRARLVLLEVAYKEFRENISKEMGRLQRRCNKLEIQMGVLEGRGGFDPRKSGQHLKS